MTEKFLVGTPVSARDLRPTQVVLIFVLAALIVLSIAVLLGISAKYAQSREVYAPITAPEMQVQIC